MLGLLKAHSSKDAERFREYTDHWPWELLEGDFEPPTWSPRLIQKLCTLARVRSAHTDDRGDLADFRGYLISFIQTRLTDQVALRTRGSNSTNLQLADVDRAIEAWEQRTKDLRSEAHHVAFDPQESLDSMETNASDSSVSSESSTGNIREAMGSTKRKLVAKPQARARTAAANVPSAPPLSGPSTNTNLEVTEGTSERRVFRIDKAATKHGYATSREALEPPQSSTFTTTLSSSDLAQIFAQDDSDATEIEPEVASKIANQYSHPPSIAHVYRPPPSANTQDLDGSEAEPLAKRRCSSIPPHRAEMAPLTSQDTHLPTPDKLLQDFESPLREAIETIQHIAADITGKLKWQHAKAAEVYESAQGLIATTSGRLNELKQHAKDTDREVQNALEELRRAKSNEQKAKKEFETFQAALDASNEEERPKIEQMIEGRRIVAETATQNLATADARLSKAKDHRDRHENPTRDSIQRSHDKAVYMAERNKQRRDALAKALRASEMYLGLTKLRPSGFLHMLNLADLAHGLETSFQKYAQAFENINKDPSEDIGGHTG